MTSRSAGARSGDRLELGDQPRRVAARRVDQHQHPPGRQVIGLMRGDLDELALRAGGVAGVPQRRAVVEPRVEVPRPHRDQPAEQHHREVVLARVGGRPSRGAQRRNIVRREIVRVGELAGGARAQLRIVAALGEQLVQLAHRALPLEAFRIDEHGAVEVVVREPELGVARGGRGGGIRRWCRRERPREVTEAAPEQRDGVEIARERAREAVGRRGVDRDPGLGPHLADRLAEELVIALHRPAALGLVGHRRDAADDMPQRDDELELPVRALDPAGDHPARALLVRERRDRRGRRGDPRAADVERATGRLQPEHALGLLRDLERRAGDQPVERAHARVILERRDRERRRARRPRGHVARLDRRAARRLRRRPGGSSRAEVGRGHLGRRRLRGHGLGRRGPRHDDHRSTAATPSDAACAWREDLID